MLRDHTPDRVTAAAHQPHFLPWLGYINKIACADVFLWLDTVQYRKNYFQNRCRIRAPDGREQWLTVAVHAHLDTSIADVEIADERWPRRVERTIEQAYGHAPFFAEYWPPLRSALAAPSGRLSELNWQLLRAILGLLQLGGVRLVRASELAVGTTDATERLVDLCRAVGARRYIAGRGGRGYMALGAFEQAGIEVVWQEFEPGRAGYRRPTGEWVEGLSVLDPLFYLGAARTLELARRAWAPEASAA